MGELSVPRPGALVITERRLERTVWYGLDGELDHDTGPGLLDTVRRLGAGAADVVVLDCANLRFVDARGLTALLVAREAATRTGAELLLARPSAMLTLILAATFLTDSLPVTASDPPGVLR